MNTMTCPTYWCRLYMSGPILVAEQIIREVAAKGGLCVTIEATKYIYKGGEEIGFVVGFLNYPRFPEDAVTLEAKAHELMYKLLDGTHQNSILLMTPRITTWITKRVN